MEKITKIHKNIVKNVSERIGISEYYAEMLPIDKVNKVESLKKEGFTAFVGDGINDAPVMKISDSGISMGITGSDAAIEAADVVLMDDKPSKIAEAIRISRRTIDIAMQNTVFAIGIKVMILVLVAIGLLGEYAMPIAVFGDVGVMILAVLNAMRALR